MDGSNKIVIDYIENTVESEENWAASMQAPVQHTWHSVDQDDILVT